MRLTLREIEQITGGTLCGQDGEIQAVTIDSREMPQNALYVAIKGDRFDGHDFCAAAVENGFCPKGEDITVKLRGGDLIVNYTDECITLTGDAKLVFEGKIYY